MTTPLKRYAIRIIHNGQSRTYLLDDLDVASAICTALDQLEVDVPAIGSAIGLAVIAKTWPDGAHLAAEGDVPLIDMTRSPFVVGDPALVERRAA